MLEHWGAEKLLSLLPEQRLQSQIGSFWQVWQRLPNRAIF